MRQGPALHVVFVENDDSFSWNVWDLLPVPEQCIEVVDTRHFVEARPLRRPPDVVVVGPGPKDPERLGLVARVRQWVDAGIPLLGICLGHQALGLAYGATLQRTAPVHGHVWRATFAPCRWLPGIQGAFEVMRYHSLALAHLSPPLECVARAPDGTVLAVSHATQPAVGFQFHPDSYATPEGAQLVRAFFTGAGLL